MQDRDFEQRSEKTTRREDSNGGKTEVRETRATTEKQAEREESEQAEGDEAEG
jgi:hypothetical protein